MRKLKFFLSFEKEEGWLDRMAQGGQEFTGRDLLGFYCFRSGQPEQVVHRIDYRTFKRRADFQDYRALFHDSGWRHIAGTKNSGAQYFKKSRDGAKEDIFSDQVSRAGRYKRMSSLSLTMAIVFFPIVISLLVNDSINVKAMFAPKLLYLTPGLWEKTGSEFWSAFLFETPFALLRGYSWLLLPLMIALYLFFALRAYIVYKRQMHT